MSGAGLRPRRRWAWLAALGLLVAACEAEPPQEAAPPEPPTEPEAAPDAAPVAVLTLASFDALPGWRDDNPAALRLSCGRLERQPDDRPVGRGGVGGLVSDWRAPCDALSALEDKNNDAVRDALERWFDVYAVTNGHDPDGLITGYYEAELRGARAPNGPDAAPLYRLPPDLVTVNLGQFRADLDGERIVGRVRDGRLVPYATRAEIDAGILADQDLELIWADDPVDVFFLHVQGSGRVVLPDGEVMRVGFAGSNGHPFYAIGRALIDENIIPRDQMSMQGIRDWLRANPARAQEIMQRNARYIFFREIKGPGPIGAQGVPLTPGRSLAVDPAFLPLGAPLYLDTTWPASERPLRRLMVAQDTGSAIKGPVRGDFFWGSGEPALAEAGRMKQQGRFFLLLPKAVTERRETSS